LDKKRHPFKPNVISFDTPMSEKFVISAIFSGLFSAHMPENRRRLNLSKNRGKMAAEFVVQAPTVIGYQY